MNYISNLFLCFLILSCNKSEQVNSTIDSQQLGQLIMVGIRGTEFSVQDSLHKSSSINSIGGVILFDYDVPSKSRPRNVESPEQLARFIKELKNNLSDDLLIAIDQEGGKVNRLKSDLGFINFPSQEDVASSNSRLYATEIYKAQAKQLASLGFNINFSPVVDLNVNMTNPIIGSLGRSFSNNSDSVYKYSRIAIEEFNKEGIYPVLKHFPGHGSSENDSHLGVVDVSSSWTMEELIPYQKLIRDSLNFGVMTAHIYNSNLDINYPATLSNSTISGILKKDLGYSGIVISDDLQMEAIRNEYTLEQTIELALNAGVDILLFANNSVYDEAIVDKAINIISKLNKSGKVSTEQLMKSISKVQRLKNELVKESDE